MAGELSDAPAEPERAPRVTSLDDFARITARLEAGASLDRVLEDEGLTATEWLRIQRDWLSRMASMASHGRRLLHDRYLERLSAFVDEASASPPVPEGDRPRVPASRIIVARKAVRASGSEPGPRPKRPSPPAVPEMPAPIDVSHRVERVPGGGNTLFATAMEARPEVTPFRTGDEALPFKSPDRAERTVPRDLPSATPFDEPNQEAPDLAGGTLDGSQVGGWDPTRTLDGSRPSPAKALPFAGDSRPRDEGKSAPPPDGSWPFPRHAEPNTRPGADPYAGLPFSRSDALPSPTPPEDPEAAPPITLEQYAWLTSLLARAPERADETLAWLQLSSERKLVVDAHFAALFRREPAEHARYQQLCARYDGP